MVLNDYDWHFFGMLLALCQAFYIKASWLGIIQRLVHAKLKQLYVRDVQIHFNAEGGTSARKYKWDHQAWGGPHPLTSCDGLESEINAHDSTCNF